MTDVIKPDPAARGIAELFQPSSQLRTPIIQRSYAWKKENVRDFLADLTAARKENRYHFLGLIVVDENGFIHDGQQRLATTFLLIQLLKERLDRSLSSLGVDHAKAVNAEGLGSVLTKALQGEKQVPAPPIQIGSGDQTVLVDPATGVTASTESTTRLVGARGTIAVHLADELDALDTDDDRIRALWSWWNFLSEQACVIELRVSAQTASSIFETLNTRGIHLSIGDLVKSYLLATITEQQQPEGMTIWSEVTTKLAKETALNEFLLHYWGSKHGHVTKGELFNALKKHIAGDAAKGVAQLKRYNSDATLYAALRNAADPFWNAYGQSTIDAIRLINSLGLTQLRYLLLAVLRDFPKGATGAKKRKAQAAALEWLSAWAIRGVVTRRTGGKPAETAFIAAATAVRQGKATTTDAIKEIFIENGRVPTNDDFKAEFARASLNSTATRVVINTLEAKLLGDDAPLGPIPSLTREHVLPQKPDWSQPGWLHFKGQAHRDYAERLGNTFLLTGVTNNELKNKSWQEKKRIILSKGVQQLPLTEEVLPEPHWTKQVIDDRQKRMAELAVERWPE